MSCSSKNSNRITVSQIVSGLGIGGGVEWVAYWLSKNLDQDRYRVIVCNLQGVGELGEKLKEHGIPVYTFNGRSSINPLHLPRNFYVILNLIKLLRREKVKIAHTHEFFSGTLGRIAAKLSKTSITILMLHNKDRWKTSIHILIDRLLAMWTDNIVANSNSVKEFTIRQYGGLNLNNFNVVHNGIDLARFSPHLSNRKSKKSELGIENNAPTLVIVGRLTTQKGHRYLLEALPAIVEKFPKLRLLIVGDDSPFDTSTKEETFQLVDTLRLMENVVFLGERKDVPELLCAADIFVLPSLWEGFGLVIAEAMAAGKPIVASKVDGIPEVVEDGVTGILVPPKEPKALANAILYLLSNPNKAKEMGQAGKERVERYFSVDKMVRKWDVLYQQLAIKKGIIHPKN